MAESFRWLPRCQHGVDASLLGAVSVLTSTIGLLRHLCDGRQKGAIVDFNSEQNMSIASGRRKHFSG